MRARLAELPPACLSYCRRLCAHWAPAGTSLHVAADRGRDTIAELLIHGGAKLDAKDAFNCEGFLLCCCAPPLQT